MPPLSLLSEHHLTLTGARLTLRPLTEDDWGTLLRWNQDPEVLYYADGDDVGSYDLPTVQDIYRSVSQQAFCFMMLYEGQPIGECWLQRMNMPHLLTRHEGEDLRRIDLLIGEKQYWGHGLGTEAIGLLTKFGFGDQRADRIFACGVADYNPRSLGAFRKCGYEVTTITTAKPGAKARLWYDLAQTRAGFGGERRPPRVLCLLPPPLVAAVREGLGRRAELVGGPPEVAVLARALPDFEVCCLPAGLELTSDLLAPARRLRLVLAESPQWAAAEYLHDHGIRCESAAACLMAGALVAYLEDGL